MIPPGIIMMVKSKHAQCFSVTCLLFTIPKDLVIHPSAC